MSGGYAPPLAAIEACSFGYGLLNLSDGRPGLVNISPWLSGPSSISMLAAIASTSASENSGPPGSPKFHSLNIALNDRMSKLLCKLETL